MYKIHCLLHDQHAHVRPVEAALQGNAVFTYDAVCDSEAMLREHPDLVLCVNDYPWDIARCLDTARTQRIPSLVLQDGILEWRCQYQNPLFGAGGGAPQHQPVLADKIACLGAQSARQIASWNHPGKVEVTGMPRLDFMFDRRFDPPANPGKCILVMTAKNPGFTPQQRHVSIRSLMDLKSCLAARPEIRVIWRVSKAVAVELEVENQLREVSSVDLAKHLVEADAVITTPSTAMLEAMIASRPVAALDYHNVPRFVPTAWTISAPNQIEQVVNEVLQPAVAKMAFQNFCLADCLKVGGDAAATVARLICKMIEAAKSLPHEAPFQLPAGLLSETFTCVADSGRPPLAALYAGNPVFQETEIEKLQVRLARAENENRRLKEELAQVRGSTPVAWLKRQARRLL